MIMLDIDSSVSQTNGDWEESAYDGHLGCTCYHAVLLFNQSGSLEPSSLRPGNGQSATG